MNAIKWELEDLSFATLYPKRLRRDRQPGRAARTEPRPVPLRRRSTTSTRRCTRPGSTATVTGRPKHYYSVYQKMIVRGRDFADIYDLVGLRVLVDSVRDCYAALGVIHARWNPVPGRFKDYIAMPKFNMYQSLHTTVIGPEGKPVELQIRTHAMHRRPSTASPRTGSTRRPLGRPPPQDDMTWLRQLLDWQQETSDPGEFLDSLRFEISGTEVFVFTPKGDVIALVTGATPVDFAYAVHTEVGHRTVGRPGQRPAGAARLRPRERRRDRGLHLQGRRSRAEPGLARASSSHRGPATRSAPGSPRSAATRRSSTARTPSPGRCASRACRCSGSSAARRCCRSPPTCA